jgi:hypothetical protein
MAIEILMGVFAFLSAFTSLGFFYGVWQDRDDPGKPTLDLFLIGCELLVNAAFNGTEPTSFVC